MTLIAGLEGDTRNYVACDSLVSEMLTGRVYLNAKAKSYVWPDEGAVRLAVCAAGDVSAAQAAFRYIGLSPAKWAMADGDLALNELMLEMKDDLTDEDAGKDDAPQLELIIGNKFGVYHAEFGDCSCVSSPGSLVAGGIGGTYALGAFSALKLDNTENRVRLACEAVMPICIGVAGPVQVWAIERE